MKLRERSPLLWKQRGYIGIGNRRVMGSMNARRRLEALLDGSQFYAPRTSSITQTRGSGTPTIVRATTTTVLGYAPAAVLADGQTLLTVASGELRHQGARRISEGVWSTVDAAGVPIPAATLDGSVVEAAATNLCLWSADFSNATWQNNNITLGANITAPDGTATLRLATNNSASACYFREAVGRVSTGGQSVTLSAFFKAGTAPYYQIGVSDLGANYALASVNVSTLAIDTTTVSGTGSIVSARVKALTNGLYRFQVTVQYSDALTYYAYSAFTSAVTALTTTNGQTGYAWGYQVELGSYATAYIPTTTAAVTRNKDVLDDQVASNLTAAAGSVAFQWTPSHNPSGTVALAGSYVDASNYTVLLHDATKYIFRKRIAGVNYDAELTASFVSGTTYDIALKWGANGINLAVDGTLGTAHANADPAQLGTRWQWGADGNGAQQAGAAIKEKFMWTRALSDSELQAVTL